MTEEERPEAKEQEACFTAIREIVQEISRLMDAAYQQYSRLVEQVLNGSTGNFSGKGWSISERIRDCRRVRSPSSVPLVSERRWSHGRRCLG